jgi:hypothetical protein
VRLQGFPLHDVPVLCRIGVIVCGRIRPARLPGSEDKPEERRQSEDAADAAGRIFTFRIHDS